MSCCTPCDRQGRPVLRRRVPGVQQTTLRRGWKREAQGVRGDNTGLLLLLHNQPLTSFPVCMASTPHYNPQAPHRTPGNERAHPPVDTPADLARLVCSASGSCPCPDCPRSSPPAASISCLCRCHVSRPTPRAPEQPELSRVAAVRQSRRRSSSPCRLPRSCTPCVRPCCMPTPAACEWRWRGKGAAPRHRRERSDSNALSSSLASGSRCGLLPPQTSAAPAPRPRAASWHAGARAAGPEPPRLHAAKP